MMTQNQICQDLSQESLSKLTRCVVVGSSGAGKSQLAKELAALLNAPYIEMDELYWGMRWQPKPKEEFKNLLEVAITVNSWVLDGDYNSVRALVWARATTVIWLNYRLPFIFWRLFCRTTRRFFSKEMLWHGNQESFRKAFFSRNSIFVWLLKTHKKKKALLQSLRDDRDSSLTWIEFSHPTQTAAFLNRLKISHASKSKESI